MPEKPKVSAQMIARSDQSAAYYRDLLDKIIKAATVSREALENHWGDVSDTELLSVIALKLQQCDFDPPSLVCLLAVSVMRQLPGRPDEGRPSGGSSLRSDPGDGHG